MLLFVFYQFNQPPLTFNRPVREQVARQPEFAPQLQNLEQRYAILPTGGLFLALSYFGTDQSQVQRYLAGRSITESRLGL